MTEKCSAPQGETIFTCSACQASMAESYRTQHVCQPVIEVTQAQLEGVFGHKCDQPNCPVCHKSLKDATTLWAELADALAKIAEFESQVVELTGRNSELLRLREGLREIIKINLDERYLPRSRKSLTVQKCEQLLLIEGEKKTS